MKEITIGKNDAGQRLDRFLEKAVPLLPPALCQKYIRIKRVKVNGKAAKRDYRLSQSDLLSLYINDEFFSPPSRENAYLRVSNPRLNVLYEDSNILLIDKKPGVLVHPGEDGSASNTLITQIQAYLYLKGEWDPADEHSFSPALCNRIDRNTGGIVIAAKNANTLRIINEKIKNRELDKYYLCIVNGVPSPPSGTLTGYLFKDAVKNRVYVRPHFEKGSKTAVTEYRTLAVSESLSLLECRLITGRTHQIRAQLSAAGHPLLGDGKYGTQSDGQRHQALYSYRIVFSFLDSDHELGYLNGKSFTVTKIDFVEKYFDSFDMH